MGFITQMEQHWLEQGKVEGERRIVLSILECRFKEIPERYSQKLQSADSKTLFKWAMKLCNDDCTIEGIFEGK